LGPVSLGYAALTAVMTRSPARTFASLLLVSPRTAMIGAESADLGASARVLRAGVVIVGTRPQRTIRRPDLLLVDGPRTVTDGFELAATLPLDDTYDPAGVLERATQVAAAAGSPWGGVMRPTGESQALDGLFDGTAATATIDGIRYSLHPAERGMRLPARIRLQRGGTHILVLRSERAEQPLGLLVLQPRLAPGVAEIVETCRRCGVELRLLAGSNAMAAQAVARRAGIAFLDGDDAMAVIHARQATGMRVAFISDSARSAAAFEACDLAIGLSSGRTSRFPARVDLLAPDLSGLAAIVDAGARRDASARDAALLSMVSNGVGVVWGLQGAPGIEQASRAVYATALAALGVGWARLRGGERSQASITRLVDPRPERWGRRSVASTLAALNTTENGLATAQATQRRRAAQPRSQRNALVGAVLEQLRSPLTGILAAGAGLSVALGSPLDVLLIGATIALNAAVGAWQEHQAGRAADVLARMGTASARVLRDGVAVTIPATEIVPGDILVLASGDRVAADARVLEAHGFEVDEAALTGESLPVAKVADGGTDASRVLLEGSDVTVGTARAVVVAVGQQTRMGATAAALETEDAQRSPLSIRLSAMLRQLLPLAAAGGGDRRRVRVSSWATVTVATGDRGKHRHRRRS